MDSKNWRGRGKKGKEREWREREGRGIGKWRDLRAHYHQDQVKSVIETHPWLTGYPRA